MGPNIENIIRHTSGVKKVERTSTPKLNPVMYIELILGQMEQMIFGFCKGHLKREIESQIIVAQSKFIRTKAKTNF